MFKKVFDAETVAMFVHHWLRSREILDEDHDLPWANTPAQYRAELIKAVEGGFYNQPAKKEEKKDGN